MQFLWLLFIVLLFNISGGECRNCFNCSSVNDHYCPEFMTGEDQTIVPYVPCDSIYDGRFCIKTTGVNGGSMAIRCFRCDASDCSGDLHDLLSDCSDVFEPYFCVKTFQELVGGSLGTTRFCSSRDMGNYCEYIRRPGDQLEYRSCVFTCSSDGCNHSSKLHISPLLTPLASLLLIFHSVKW